MRQKWRSDLSFNPRVALNAQCMILSHLEAWESLGDMGGDLDLAKQEKDRGRGQ